MTPDVYCCFCHSAVVFRSDGSSCIFIAVCSHSFSTDLNCVPSFPSLGGCSLPSSLHGASSFSNNDALCLLRKICNLLPSFRLGLHCVCPSTMLPAFRTMTLCAYCVYFVICAVNFLDFRARYFRCHSCLLYFGGSCSELTLWNTGAEFLPFCRRAIFSFVLKILHDRKF